MSLSPELAISFSVSYIEIKWLIISYNQMRLMLNEVLNEVFIFFLLFHFPFDDVIHG